MRRRAGDAHRERKQGNGRDDGSAREVRHVKLPWLRGCGARMPASSALLRYEDPKCGATANIWRPVRLVGRI